MLKHGQAQMRVLAVFAMAAFAASISVPADAQLLSNRPFAFKNRIGGGVGMSIGGRQAILNEELFGATPDNLVRGPVGELLDVTEAGRGAAVVNVPGSSFIPGFRGADFRRGTVGMSVGAFNSFFVPKADGTLAIFPFESSSSDTVNTWTGRVISGTGVSFRAGNPVDVWTSLVFGMPAVR